MGTSIHPLVFARSNLAASLTDAALEAGVGGGADYLAPYSGDIVALAVCSNAARTAGTATFDITVNGVKVASALLLQAILDGTNTQRRQVKVAHGVVSVVAGDRIGVVVTTDASWAPTTADLTATVWATIGGYEP